MRLIDADTISFRCAYNGDCMARHEQCLKCSDYVVDAESIQEQPTAYDVEKVVEDVRIDCCAMGFDDSQIEIIVKGVRNGGKE